MCSHSTVHLEHPNKNTGVNEKRKVSVNMETLCERQYV